MAGTIGAAVIAWVTSTTVAATSVAAIATGALIEGVATIGLSYVAQSVLTPKPKTDTTASYSTLQTGGILPQSFLFGETATAGSLVYFNDWGKDGKTPNAYETRVIALSDLPVNALTGLQAYGKSCTYGSGTPDSDMGYAIPQFTTGGKDYLWVKFYDGTQTTADSWLVSKFSSDPDRPYTSSRVGYGRAYVIVTIRINQKLFTGDPGFKFQVEGAKWYDITKDTTAGGSGSHRWGDPSTWEYTNNPQIIRYNIRRGVYYNSSPSQWLFGPQNMSAARLPYDNWAAAINDCATEVDNQAGGTEAQYRCGGEVTVDTEPADLDESLMRACNGRSIEIGGIYKTTTGVIGSAVASYTDDDFIVTQQKTFDQYPGLSGTVNGITGHFPDPTQNWAMVDAPGLFDSDLEVEDGNRQQLADISYDCVPFAEQVQRNMKAALAEERRWRIHTAVLPHTAWALEPGDPISWTSDENGYDNKLFRVESTQLMQNRDVQITIREADPADYDWDPSADFVPVPAGSISGNTLPSQSMVGWAVESVVIPGDDDREKPGIQVSWGTDDIDDVDGVIIDIRLTSSSAIVWSGETPHSVENFLLGSFIPPANLSADTAYQVRGKYRPISTRDTDWSDWLDVTTDDIPDATYDGIVDRLKLSDDLQNLNDFLGSGLQDALNKIRNLSQIQAEAALIGAVSDQNIRQSLSSTAGNLKADYTSLISAATSDIAANASDIETLQAALTGYTGSGAVASAFTATNANVTTNAGDIAANTSSITELTATLSGYSSSSTVASAISALSATVTSQGGSITTNAAAITSLTATQGNFSASGLFRVGVATTQSGASSTIGLSAAASSGGSSASASLFLNAMSDGTSQVVAVANKFIITDGTHTGTPFLFDGTTLYVNSAVIPNLDASIITTGELDVNTLIANNAIVGGKTVSGDISNGYTTAQTGTITAAANVATEIIRISNIKNLGGNILAFINFCQTSKADSGSYSTCYWSVQAVNTGAAFGTGWMTVGNGNWYANDAGQLRVSGTGIVTQTNLLGMATPVAVGDMFDLVLAITGDGSKRPVIGLSQMSASSFR